MIDWLISLILIGEVIILTRVDKIIYGTWITPFSLFSVPYTIVVMTAFLFAPAFGFISLYVESVLIWVVGLLFFWLGGLTIALPLSKAIRAKIKGNQPFKYEKESGKLVLILAWITIIIMSYGLLVSLKSLGWQQIGTDEFAKSYGYGWVGHFRSFSMGLTVFLIGTADRKNAFGLFTIFVIFVLYMLYPVKSWVIVPVLAGLVYRTATGRFKFSITKIILILFLVFSIFITTYIIELSVKNIQTISNIEVYEQLTRHFMTYIFSGVLALGEVTQTGVTNLNGDPHVIFAPFVNLYAFISSGDIISKIAGQFSVISIDGIKQSNVHTFFGTLLINLGYFSSAVYVICFGVFVYGVFTIAKITRNCWVMVIWSFIAPALLLGWFEFYFWHLAIVEVPIYCAILGCLFRLRGWRYQRREYSGTNLSLIPVV